MLPILLSLVVTQSPPPLVSADVDAPPPTPVAEVVAPPREDKHAAPLWQATALATAIVPTSFDSTPFVFGMRGELDVWRISGVFTFDRGVVTPFTMAQSNEWTGLLGFSAINNTYARVRVQGGLSALTADTFTARFGPSLGVTARAGLPVISAEVAALFTPVGGLRQFDARAELVLRGGVFELHGGYRVRFYDAAEAGTLDALFTSTPLAGPSIAVGLSL